MKRFIEEGEAGLEDRKRGRPKGVCKVDLKAIDAVRRLQKNPALGEFRAHAALAQVGIHLSPRTCGRILTLNRRLYGYEKPTGAGKSEKKEMPFASLRRHEFWTADVRYVDHRLPQLGNVYAISILENHSRAILGSALTRSQDTIAFLSVLYRAVERYGSPETLLTDSGSVFLANRAKAIYEALNIRKEEIEKGRPWQSYIETTFNIQKRMADYHFGRAESWPELVAVHDGWVADYNGQSHWAHRERKDGRRSPAEVLGWLSGVRYHSEDLERAFFSTRFTRKLDSLGYATFRRWRLYGEEGLAGNEATLWLHAKNLTVEYAGEPLSRYDVEPASGVGTGGLLVVRRPTLFETSYPRSWAPAEALRAGRPRRGRVAQSIQARRVRSPAAPRIASVAAGSLCLHGGHLGNERSRIFCQLSSGHASANLWRGLHVALLLQATLKGPAAKAHGE